MIQQASYVSKMIFVYLFICCHLTSPIPCVERWGASRQGVAKVSPASSILLFVVGRGESVMSCGQRFMTDLLVSSLMADGGLETSLNLAVKAEIKEFEEKKVPHFGFCFLFDFQTFMHINGLKQFGLER